MHGDGNPHAALDWVHDAAAWGTPSQEWSTADKAIWLLYVAEKATGQTELTATCIAKTFNKHFKQAKTITSSHVGRDLGKVKIGKDAQVGENATSEPARWFLIDAGRREAERLIAESRGVVSASV